MDTGARRAVALVTGASSGLGAEFARQLGALGLDLVLVARRADRLQAVRAEIETRAGVQCHVLARDLSRPEAPQELFDWTTSHGLEVEWLVNNAGFATMGAMASLPLERELAEIQVNVTTVAALTQRYLAGMVARRRGYIVNVASVGAFTPTPYMATYTASKAFVLTFSEAVAGEVSGLGVHVQALCPGAARTEFHEVAGATGRLPALAFMMPEAVVRRSIAAARRGSGTFVPGWLNQVAVHSTRVTPRRLLVWIAGRLFRPAGA